MDGRPLLAAAVALLAAACTSYPTLKDRTALLAPTMEYYAPASLGAQPTLVILVSGCGGLNGLQGPKAIMRNYAAAATSSGAHVAVMDSFASRGIDFETSVSTVCSGLRLHGNERAGDIVAAERLAEEHWNTNFSGVILAGWSHGGWTVMELLSAGAKAREVGGFRIEAGSHALTPDAVALFYPYCGFLNTTGRSAWSFKGPLLLLTADADAPGADADCKKQVGHARGDDMTNVEAIHFATNTHAFDEEDQVPGSEFTYDPDATSRSLSIFSRFVKDQIGPLR